MVPSLVRATVLQNQEQLNSSESGFLSILSEEEIGFLEERAWEIEGGSVGDKVGAIGASDWEQVKSIYNNASLSDGGQGYGPAAVEGWYTGTGTGNQIQVVNSLSGELSTFEATAEPNYSVNRLSPSFYLNQDVCGTGGTGEAGSPYQLVECPDPTLIVIIDNLNLNFATLSVGTLAKLENSLQLNSNLPAGYSLYIEQNHPLLLNGSNLSNEAGARNIIAGTSCDDGLCTIEQAGFWSNPNAVGAGYSVAGEDSVADFGGGSKYRPFPSANLGQEPVLIAQDQSVDNVLSDRTIELDYQIAVSGANEAGTYSNIVSYTIVPNF